jgi:hypothetical protein
MNLKRTKLKQKGKKRMQVENFQNQFKKIFKGKKCESIYCQNILGLDNANIVCEHLLQQGKYPQFKMHSSNVAFVCGCINLDNYKDQSERLLQIEKHFPTKIKWVKSRLKKLNKEI